MKKISSPFLRSIVLLFSFVSLVACTPEQEFSEAELTALESSAFSQNFDIHGQVGDVHSSVDALPATRPFHMNSITEALEVPIRDCNQPGLYEAEKQMAITEALNDPSGETVPVKFAYSFGKKHDTLAKWANKRAVLSHSGSRTSIIPVGGKKSSSYHRYSAYYEVDHSKVKRQYITGQKCFFSTIKIDPERFNRHKGYYDFIDVDEEDARRSSELTRNKKTMAKKIKYLKHMIHYMYYGFCRVGRCAPDQAFAGEFANRLFNEVGPREEGEEPQIIKIYMADFRSDQLKHDVINLSEETTRGLEIDDSISNIVNVCRLQDHYHDVTKNMSLPAESNGYIFQPVDGAVQLIENILSHDVDGTMLSSQYTPIVIDLDGDGVKTSSLRWGRYFNMAALDDKEDSGQKHRTAWLGGDYVDHNLSAGDFRVRMDVRLQSKDGFLVLPDENLKVTSSAQMFGDNMLVGGKTYDNGFLALQAFAGKDCESSDIKDKYVGPWDNEIYTDKLKIWVDRNRNGVSENGEIQSLRDSNVAAINACHIVHADETDSFGNGTHLRSAVLMLDSTSYLYDSLAELENFLAFGRGYDGGDARFHLAIDLIFKVNTDDRCMGPKKIEQDYQSLLESEDSQDEGGHCDEDHHDNDPHDNDFDGDDEADEQEDDNNDPGAEEPPVTIPVPPTPPQVIPPPRPDNF